MPSPPLSRSGFGIFPSQLQNLPIGLLIVGLLIIALVPWGRSGIFG